MSPPSSSPRLQPQPDLPPPLAWSTTLTLSPPTATSGGAVPAGDKIHLPQSALEQLLAAAASSSSSHLSTSTYYDNDGYASAESWARRAPPQQQQRNGDGLPHPLIVKLSNPANGVSVYAVPREFSADEGSVVVASFLRRALGLHDTPTDTPATPINLNIEAASLPKGTSVRLRPLEAGYDDEDWKAILERHLREGFATVQEGLVLEVPRGHGRGGVWRFLVDQALPGGTICVVDTDLEVTIEALDEAQARETLKRRLAKPTTGGKLAVGQEVAGAVAPGEEHFYELAAWDRGKPVQIVLDGDGEAAEWVDVFVATDLQHHKPRIGEYIWGDMGWVFPKTISIEPGNVALEGAKTVTVGIRGWRDPDEDGDGEAGEARGYTLRITQDPATIDLTSDDDDEDIKPDHTRCPNCRRQISSRTYILHSSHCARQILRCPQCPATFPRSSPLSKTHWHCALCTSSGPTATSHTKHLRTTHTPRPCPSCSHPTSSLPDLATHRTSTCPSKLHLCAFCHLLLPQGPGAGTDAEVILTGLTRHELTCGGRTTECPLCARRTRLRDLPLHLQSHELARLARPPPALCRNPNCTRAPAAAGNTNALGLCAECFGPLYAPAHDPTGALLRRRLERKLLRQLLAGCGRGGCRNKVCKTGAGMERGVGTREAGPVVKAIVEATQGGGEVPLCVDDVTARRRELAEGLAAESVVDGGGEGRGGYGLAWCVRAVEEARGEVEAARRWLEREGVREGER